MQDLPDMLEVWLRLCVAVNKPSKANASREGAGLSLALPMEPEVLSHGAYIISGGLRVAVAIIWAELTEHQYHLESLDTTREMTVINLRRRGSSGVKLYPRLRNHHSSQGGLLCHHHASQGHQRCLLVPHPG